jgi:hypothetical protein
VVGTRISALINHPLTLSFNKGGGTLGGFQLTIGYWRVMID